MSVRFVDEKALPCYPQHTPSPDGYQEYHDWAAEKSKTHTQERCPDCGRWAIWVPKNKENP